MQNQGVVSVGRSSVPALNYHLWRACNMRCRYCFAGFAECKEGRACRDEELARCGSVIDQAVRAGIRKITFSGGEPLLCPWLYEAVAESKRRGLTTMIVSNGSRIDDAWLEKFAGVLDWIGVSIDSLLPATNQVIGRCAVGHAPFSGEDYARLCNRIVAAGIRVKINTVVSAFNWREDFSTLLDRVRPERWKVFQVLEIQGQNEVHFSDCRVSGHQYQEFLARHAHLPGLVPEDNAAMTGSYLIINPEGCFFDNTLGRHRTSDPVWQVGWEAARAQIAISATKFNDRGGDWTWDEAGALRGTSAA